MSSELELVEFPAPSSAIVEDIRYLKEQMKAVKKQLARSYGNIASQPVQEGDDLSCSFKEAVEDTTEAGINNAAFSSELPQCHTIDELLGTWLKRLFHLDNRYKFCSHHIRIK